MWGVGDGTSAVNWSCPVLFPDGAEQLSEHLYEVICLPLSAQPGVFTTMLMAGVVCPGVLCPRWLRRHQTVLGCPPGMWL